MSNEIRTEHDRVDKATLREVLIERDLQQNATDEDDLAYALEHGSLEDLAHAPGWGVTGALKYRQGDRWGSSGGAVGIDPFERRLGRLVDGPVERVDLGDGRIVFDFSTSNSPLWLDGTVDDRASLFRGESGDVSTVFLSSREGEWSVDEFCLRLAPPLAAPSEREYDRLQAAHDGETVPRYVTEIAEATGRVVAEIGAPTDETLVWVRPPGETTSLITRYIATGRTPHVAAYEAGIPAGTFLDWLSAFLREYRPHPDATGTIKRPRFL